MIRPNPCLVKISVECDLNIDCILFLLCTTRRAENPSSYEKLELFASSSKKLENASTKARTHLVLLVLLVLLVVLVLLSQHPAVVVVFVVFLEQGDLVGEVASSIASLIDKKGQKKTGSSFCIGQSLFESL